MLKEFLFWALICSSFALKNDELNAQYLEKLENLTNGVSENILETLNDVDQAREVYDEIVQDRMDALIGAFHKLSNQIRETFRETIVKAIMSKKLVGKYQCISTAGEEIMANLNATHEQIPERAENVKDKSVAALHPYKMLLSEVQNLLTDFKEEKKLQILQEEKESALEEILKEATEKVKTANDLSLQIREMVKKNKFEFFEIFVDFVHETEKVLKKEHDRGVWKIPRCLRNSLF